MTQQLIDQISFYIDSFNELNESISSHFEPLTNVAYLPSRAIAKASGLSEVTALLFVTFTLGFLLSFGFNFLTLPKHRKLYTVLTSLFLGFFLHGLGYFLCLLQISCFWPFLRFLSRQNGYYLAVGVVGAIMAVRNFVPFWENNLDGTLRTHFTVIFMRVQMFMCNYVDGELLDDSVKGKHLTASERKYAAYVRELPAYKDWFIYNMFAPFSFIGESVEYGLFDDYINMRGDITKMRPFSNVFTAIQRFVHSIICIAVFYYLSMVVDPMGMAKLDFID